MHLYWLLYSHAMVAHAPFWQTCAFLNALCWTEISFIGFVLRLCSPECSVPLNALLFFMHNSARGMLYAFCMLYVVACVMLLHALCCWTLYLLHALCCCMLYAVVLLMLLHALSCCMLLAAVSFLLLHFLLSFALLPQCVAFLCSAAPSSATPCSTAPCFAAPSMAASCFAAVYVLVISCGLRCWTICLMLPFWFVPPYLFGWCTLLGWCAAILS